MRFQGWVWGFAALLMSAVPGFAASCDSLSTLRLPHATITLAQSVAAGAFTPPAVGFPPAAGTFQRLPAFCRVAATLRPSSDSDIRIEVWMPVAGWNGKLQSVGNGAWAGTISYTAMASALAAGYASASTDTGHAGNRPDFIPGHPEKVIDFAYRAVHEMTTAAKQIAAAYYGGAPARSYWNGCSTGGRQALVEAQRYPDDYDGIVAGAAANYTTHLQAQQVWIAEEAHKDAARSLPPAKLTALHQAVLRACDALDGVKDGVLEDPTRCHFDPAALACKGGDGPSCLTAPQIDVAREIYRGPADPRTGRRIFPGLEPGSESGWSMLAGEKPMSYAVEIYSYLVFRNPAWNFLSFDPSKDVALAEKTIGKTMDSTDPDLRPFFAHGGKLLMYHGWADPGIAPLNSVNYYESVVDTTGAAAKESIRLFMVPGMGHCRSGDGTDTFDAVSALDEWVEKGAPPRRMAASHLTRGSVDKTRPLCPYPQSAHYMGSGDPNDASNFVCK